MRQVKATLTFEFSDEDFLLPVDKDVRESISEALHNALFDVDGVSDVRVEKVILK